MVIQGIGLSISILAPFYLYHLVRSVSGGMRSVQSLAFVAGLPAASIEDNSPTSGKRVLCMEDLKGSVKKQQRNQRLPRCEGQRGLIESVGFTSAGFYQGPSALAWMHELKHGAETFDNDTRDPN